MNQGGNSACCILFLPAKVGAVSVRIWPLLVLVNTLFLNINMGAMSENVKYAKTLFVFVLLFDKIENILLSLINCPLLF
jgi:hypothetical protein